MPSSHHLDITIHDRSDASMVGQSCRRLVPVRFFFSWLMALSVVLVPAIASGQQEVSFDRQIRSILSNNCYQCHGPDADQRKAKLRLDTRQGALAPREDHRTVFPGKPTQSELFRRITSGDPDERMPPPDSKKTLTPAQVELIGTWIREGAQWQEHWAWVTPQQPAVPFPADYLDFVTKIVANGNLQVEGARKENLEFQMQLPIHPKFG